MVHYCQQLLQGLSNTHTHTKFESKNFKDVAIQVGQVLCIPISIIQSNLRSANTVLCKNITLYYSTKAVNLTFYTIITVSTHSHWKSNKQIQWYFKKLKQWKWNFLWSIKGHTSLGVIKVKIRNDNETFIQYIQRSMITEKQLIYIKRMDNIRV